MTQLPASQDGVPFAATHRLPQAPQSATLVARSVSHSPSPSQSPMPGSHTVAPQPSAPQKTVSSSLSGSHTLPHSPQLATSRVKSRSHPFSSRSSQSSNPSSQLIPQAPSSQVGEPLMSRHTLKQVPQFCGSSSRFTSQPFSGSPSQSSNGASHSSTWQT